MHIMSYLVYSTDKVSKFWARGFANLEPPTKLSTAVRGRKAAKTRVIELEL
jgi:hypothetical protein